MAVTVTNVSSTVQLYAALAAATGETQIRLAPGNYGYIGLNNVNPLATVTITSDNLAARANINTLQVRGSSNLTFSELFFQHAPVNSTDGSSDVYVANSHDLKFVHNEFVSVVNTNNLDDGGGMELVSSQRVQILDNKFHDLKFALLTHETDHVVIAGNDVSLVREGFDNAGNNYLTIDSNLFHDFRPYLYGATPDHPDAIQMWTTNSVGSNHVEITNNAFLTASGHPIQGIFIRSERGDVARHSDFLIADNAYIGQSRHGISVSDVDGVHITGNTVVSAPKYNDAFQYLDPAIWTTNTTGAVVDHNIASLFMSVGDTGRVASNNIDAWDLATGVGTPYNQIFAHSPSAGSPAAWFVAKPGSVAAAQGIGYANETNPGNWAAVTPTLIEHYNAVLDHAGAAYHIV